jgi:hypothetical protein
MSDRHNTRKIRAIEIKERRSGPLISLSVILIMFILLSASVAYYLTSGKDGNGTDDDGGKNGDDQIVIDLSDSPDELLANSRMTFSGEISTGEGIDLEGASVALTVPGIFEEVFRTVSDPGGSFKVNVELPFMEYEGIYTIEISAEKDGYEGGFLNMDMKYIPPPNWTFMIYMSDCDLEKWAIDDINEMEMIGSSDLMNVILQIDRWESISPKDDRSNGNWTGARRYRLNADDDIEKINSEEIADLGEIDSADPEELVEFATWTAERYPADNYALILWNHGSGTEGICWEQSTEEESVMTIDQLSWALDRITTEIGQALEIIGFDACLMSAFEVAYEIADFGNLMIGSEITEPAFGWDYSTLGDLREFPYLESVELAERFMIDYLAQMGRPGSKTSMTMGVYDLGSMDEIALSLNDLSNTIADSGSVEMYNMKIARQYAQPIQEGHSSDAVDLYDFIENIRQFTETSSIREKSDSVLENIQRAVLHFNVSQAGGWSLDGLNGLSIYAPDFRDVLDKNEEYSDLKFAEDTSWISLLNSYYDHLEENMDERILHFDEAFLSCSASDEDGDGCRDTLKHTYTVSSSEEDVEAFLGINIYNLRGDHITSLDHRFNVSSNQSKTFTVSFRLDEDEGGPGLYRIASFLCIGNSFDRGYFQDYTRSGYRWLEVYNG